MHVMFYFSNGLLRLTCGFHINTLSWGSPDGCSGEEAVCQCRRHWFNPWPRKIPEQLDLWAYWICALEPGSCNCWSPMPRAGAPQQEKPPQWQACAPQLESNPCLLQLAEKAMAPHSSPLAWRIPGTEEPGRLQSTGSRRVGLDRVTSLSLFTFMHWRRKRQPIPVFPGESKGVRSLVDCCLWGLTELDTTEAT